MIHHPEDEINLSEDSVFCHPRATTYIGLQKEQVIRLPPPSKDPCTHTYPAELEKYLEPKFKEDYSMQACREVVTK